MTVATGTMTPPPPTYPVRVRVVRPEKQSRLTNFPLGIGLLIRFILVIPHILILYIFGLVAWLLYFIATFGILFTGSYPRGMFDFVVNYMRWTTNVAGYIYSLYDKYPPFSGEPQDYPLSFEVDYPERSSRLTNFPFFGLLIRELLLIPHLIVVLFLALITYLILFIAMFAILFTGSFPAGMHGFVTGYLRWSTRLSAYIFGLTDKYPPFSLE